MPILGIVASSMKGTPTSPVAGYKLWLDASDTATITQSGGAVSQWSDKSGFASNFTQGTGANQPTTNSRTINSLNVIDFDGTNDFMSCPSSTSLFNYLHNTTGGTVFFVGLIDSTSAAVLLRNTTGSSADTGMYGDLNGGSDFTFVVNGSPGAGPATSSSNISITTSTAFYLSYKFDANNATAANRLLISKNGGSFLGNNTATFSPSGSNATLDMRISGGAYNGVIGEVLIYSGILSSGDITLNQSYLAAKWGI